MTSVDADLRSGCRSESIKYTCTQVLKKQNKVLYSQKFFSEILVNQVPHHYAKISDYQTPTSY